MKENQAIANVGQRIAATRRLHRISQATLARLSGIDASHISRIERGHAQPELATVIRLANALRVTLDDLVPLDADTRRHLPCPVTPSGHCLAELIRARSRLPSNDAPESFSPRTVRMLRRFADWLLETDPEARTAVETLLNELPHDARFGAR